MEVGVIGKLLTLKLVDRPKIAGVDTLMTTG